MLALENKFKEFACPQASNVIFEENEFIKKFLVSTDAELFSASVQNAPPDFHDLSTNSGFFLIIFLFLTIDFRDFGKFLPWLFYP